MLQTCEDVQNLFDNFVLVGFIRYERYKLLALLLVLKAKLEEKPIIQWDCWFLSVDSRRRQSKQLRATGHY